MFLSSWIMTTRAIIQEQLREGLFGGRGERAVLRLAEVRLHLQLPLQDVRDDARRDGEAGARFRRKKIVTKIITKIITKCNFDFQTCVNYQFFPFQDNFFGSSELRGGSQY